MIHLNKKARGLVNITAGAFEMGPQTIGTMGSARGNIVDEGGSSLQLGFGGCQCTFEFNVVLGLPGIHN